MIYKILIFLLAANISIFSQCINPLNIHSHNNYAQDKPLFNALKNCVKSIEVDVILKENNLFVAHDKEDIRQNVTLQKLYLDPLTEILDNKKSGYYFNYELFLLIDFKTEALSTFNKLNEILTNYKKYLSFVDKNGNLVQRKIRIIISGNRPDESVLKKDVGFCFLDGRISDIGKGKSSNLYPIISDNWNFVINRIGNPENKRVQKLKLKDLISSIHKENKFVRFWGIHDDPEHWQLQKGLGVDLINTDRVSDLNKFLISKN
jgi:glycerophosphoryl diester phosphodiesterase